MKKYKERFNNAGFSLIELVVAMGILFILSTAGVLGYQGLIRDNRHSAMELTASTVGNEAISYVADFDDNTNVKMAVDEFNDKKYTNDFIVSFVLDSDNCVNIVVSDTTNKVKDPVQKKNSKLCNLESNEIE